MATSLETETETPPAAAAVASFTIAMARSSILEALQRVAPVASKKTTLPVLNMMLVEAAGDATPQARRVRLTTTDLERTVETTFGATTTGAGRALLPAKRLLEIVSSFPTASVVTIVVNGKRAKVSSGKSKFDVYGLDVSEFPNAPTLMPKIETSIDAKTFVSGLGRVAPFVSTVVGNAESGALLEAADDGLHIVALDVRRMGKVKIADDASFRAQCILPPESFASVRQLFSGDETLRLTANAHGMKLEGKHSTLTSRLLEGSFPPYRMLVRQPAQSSIIVYAAELVNVLKRVALVAPEDNHCVVFYMHDDELHLVAESAERGTGSDVVPCRYGTGDKSAVRRIAVNANFLISVVDGIGADEKGEIAIQLCGEKRAIYVRPADNLESPTMGICMPLSLLTDIPDEA